MKKRNRILAALLSAMLCVGLLAGCSSSDSSESTEESSGSESSEASSGGSGSYNICFIVKHTDEHFNRVMAGAQAYADENEGVTVDFQSPTSTSDFEGQQNMIETSINSGAYDGLIVAPLQSDTVANLVSNTDMVVVACDTDFDSDNKTSFVGTGNEEAAKAGAEEAAELAIDKGVDAPKAAIITGVQGDETHEQRMAGFKEGIESKGGEVVEVQYTDDTADKATTATEAIIQKYQDGLDIIMSTDDNLAMGCVKAINDSGTDAFKNDCIVCGFDGNKDSIVSVQDGSLTLEIAQQSYDMGYKAMEACVNALNGEEVDDFIDSGSTNVTADSADEYIDHMKEINCWDE